MESNRISGFQPGVAMSAVILNFAPDMESKLRLAAHRVGHSLEDYLQSLAADHVAASPTFSSEPRPTPDEFDRLIRELASGPTLPVLPADFSRNDIYDDHD
jgi:hypothetical protein